MQLHTFEDILDIFYSKDGRVRVLSTTKKIPRVLRSVKGVQEDVVFQCVRHIQPSSYVFVSLQSYPSQPSLNLHLIGRRMSSHFVLPRDVIPEKEILYCYILNHDDILRRDVPYPERSLVITYVVSEKGNENRIPTSLKEPYVEWTCGHHSVSLIPDHFLYRFGKFAKYVSVIGKKETPRYWESRLVTSLSSETTIPFLQQETIVEPRTFGTDPPPVLFLFIYGTVVIVLTCLCICVRR